MVPSAESAAPRLAPSSSRPVLSRISPAPQLLIQDLNIRDPSMIDTMKVEKIFPRGKSSLLRPLGGQVSKT